MAHDFYELAEMLRLYIFEVSGEQVAKEWDPTGHPDASWVARIYGVKEVKFGSSELMRPLIRQFGLDPSYRVRWLVEGDTEEAFIDTYSNLMGMNMNEYVTFRNFEGDTNFKKRLAVIDQELQTAKEEQCFVTLTFDDTKETRDRLGELQKQGLVTLRYILCDPDFERQNFTAYELTEVVFAWASDECISIPIKKEEFAKELEMRLSANPTPTNVARPIKSIFREKSIDFWIDKGMEWGGKVGKVSVY